jgi:hypothetical protein
MESTRAFRQNKPSAAINALPVSRLVARESGFEFFQDLLVSPLFEKASAEPCVTFPALFSLRLTFRVSEHQPVQATVATRVDPPKLAAEYVFCSPCGVVEAVG